MAILSAYLLGAERVIAIDNLPERLRLASDVCGATTLNHNDVEVAEALRDLTGGRGPDACIDAVGMEAHGTDVWDDLYDRTQQTLMMQPDRLAVIRQMIRCCRKGGTISLLGVYGGTSDKLPLGIAFVKNLRWRMGNMHGPKYIPRVLEHCRAGRANPAFVYSHRLPLRLAPEGYTMFRNKEDECVKILLQP